jgi:pimeloyl-ACP methyl ester carboxylesterase
VGWLETPAQHLRVIVRIEDTLWGQDGQAATCQGTITSPDQSPKSLPLTDGVLTKEKEFSFRVAPAEGSNATYAFKGLWKGNRILGTLEQSGASLPLELVFAASLPDEGAERLAANSAWKGDLDLVVRKIGIRFRVYDRPPFATEEKPRLYFDSLAESVNGFPVTLTQGDDSQALFAIQGIPGNAKYAARLDPSLDRLQGRFLQGYVPLSLEMTRVEELRDQPNDTDSLVRWVRRVLSADPLDPDLIPPPKPGDDPERPTQPSPETIKVSGVREEPFVIEQVDYSKPKVKQNGVWVQPSFRIAGTVTWPETATAESSLPAVVLISGSGPQDRDETIGSHKPFRQLAHWLALQGMASLRYDDRGIGESTGEFLKGTTSDFADDALAVWQHARGLKGIDRRRVGLLGHSEGGIIAPMVAANQLEVAFLILLAPPGLPGGDILATQIDRMSELQGVDAENRRSAMELQRELQQLALDLPPDSDEAEGLVRKAVGQRWNTLRTMSDPNTGESEAERKKRIVNQVVLQFQGLRTPWMRYFLEYDPAANWLLMRSPTLAIWGERDVQVLPYPNRDQLAQIIERNPKLRADLVVLSELNHLMQRSQTGMPDEYKKISETIDPSALEVILDWMKQNQFVP